MQYRLKKLYSHESVNENNFKYAFLKTYSKASKMEEKKFVPPKFSEALKDLTSLIKEMGSPDLNTDSI
jgi:hypothetical protein